MSDTSTQIRAGLTSLPLDRALFGVVGPLVFTGAITPHNLETGELALSLQDVDRRADAVRYGAMFLDVPGDRVLAQAWQVYSNMVMVLDAAGVSPMRVCRQRVFVRDIDSIGLVERVMDHFLDAASVATTIVEFGTEGVDPDIAVQAEFVALCDEAADLQPVHDPSLHELLRRRYPAAVKARQFIFVSSMPGINPATGSVAREIDEIGEVALSLDQTPYVSARQRAVLAQTWFTFEHIRTAVVAAGGQLSDLVKVNGWLDFPMRDFDPVRPVRNALFPEVADKHASTGLWVGRTPTNGALLAYDAVAVVSGLAGGKEVRCAPSQIVSYYVGAAAGAGAVFTCGEVPIDEDAPRVISEASDLDGSMRRLRFGRLEQGSGIEPRAEFVYRKLEGHLRAYGSSLDKVVYQVVYLTDLREHSALELVARSAFGGRVPATTTVPIRETSPFTTTARLEIEVVAVM